MSLSCIENRADIFAKGVFKVDWVRGLTLQEIAHGVTVDEIRAKTGAPFKVADDLKLMALE